MSLLAQSPAVEVEGLGYSYGEIKALDGLTLRIEQGVTYGLLGPNGAGKSTLIRVLVGLLRPQKGRGRGLGRPPGRGVAQEIGYMPQLSALYLELTAQENVGFFARLYGLARRGEGKGGGGGGLDPELRVAFWEHFQALVKEGKTLVISSHTMDDAAHCQRLAFLRQGRVVGEGGPQELKAATVKRGATLEEAFLHFIRKGGERVP